MLVSFLHLVKQRVCFYPFYPHVSPKILTKNASGHKSQTFQKSALANHNNTHMRAKMYNTRKKIDETEFLLSWKVEDIFLLLKECGGCLYAQENDGAFWPPHGMFQKLVELNKKQHSMPGLFRNRTGNQFVLTNTSETASSLYSEFSAGSDNPD